MGDTVRIELGSVGDGRHVTREVAEVLADAGLITLHEGADYDWADAAIGVPYSDVTHAVDHVEERFREDREDRINIAVNAAYARHLQRRAT